MNRGIGWLILAAASGVALMFLMTAFCARARDLDGRYAQSQLKPSFESVRPCCSDADGTALSDVDLEADLSPPGSTALL